MVRFRLRRKTNHILSLARAKRARDAKNAFRLCPFLNYLFALFLSSFWGTVQVEGLDKTGKIGVGKGVFKTN
ncbi:MAG: hypothetical protein U5L45_01465 [Saprospiraceae bacterium]|nr:hypothetical protein [Saprospiraceae bacterium]